MDALSSSVTSLNVPIIQSKSREFYNFKIPTASHLPQHPQFSSTTKPNPISNTATKFAHHNFTTPPFFTSSQTSSLKRLPTVHRRAAVGYAAALVDAARCNNSLESLERDAKRFSKWLRNEHLRAILTDASVEEREKGRVVKEVAEKGGFHRHLVALVKMLVEKNKMGMVSQVLEEFERIYDELTRTRLVLVSSRAKTEARR